MILRSLRRVFEAGAGVARGSLLIKQECLRKLVLILGFTALGFAVMGYHPGLEDDGIYLPAVKAHLNSALFPFHAEFFRLQVEATVFDGWMARFVQLTGSSVEWAELF